MYATQIASLAVLSHYIFFHLVYLAIYLFTYVFICLLASFSLLILMYV